MASCQFTLPYHIQSKIVDTVRCVALGGRDTLEEEDEFNATFFLGASKNVRTEGRVVNICSIRALDHVEPAVWSLRNHLALCQPSMNRRATVAIMCMRRALGGRVRVRPLHVLQILQRMKYVVVHVGKGVHVV